MPFRDSLLLLLPMLALWVRMTLAHSWIECIDTDRSVVFDRAHEFIYGGPESAGTCQGYQRNYRGRGIGVHDEELMVKILKDDYTKPNVHVCKPGAQAPIDSPQRGFKKRIAVTPGQRIFFAYMPNGHVAVDKAARGTLYGLYWSGQPNVDLLYTSDLTEDKLIDGQRHDFDDGVCGQKYSNKVTQELSGRAGDSFPCVGDFAIPHGTAPGVYSIVWMWKFWDEVHDRREIVTVGGSYGGASYSSCFDVLVLGSNESRADETSYDFSDEQWTSLADAQDESAQSSASSQSEMAA